MEKNLILREVERLAGCGIIRREKDVIDSWVSELTRKQYSPFEVVAGVSRLIDSRPAFEPKVSDLFIHIQSHRDEISRQQELQNRPVKEETRMPNACRVALAYLSIKDPTEEDLEKVIQAHREEVAKHPVGSDMRREWTTAGLAWSNLKNLSSK